MDESAYDWLLREALEHLESDPVGVYEILWIAQGSDFGMESASAKNLTREVAKNIVASGKAEFIFLQWPKNNAVPGDRSSIDLSSDSVFEPDSNGVYLALELTS